MGDRPCSLALAATRVPATKFVTRVELLDLLDRVYRTIESDPAAKLDLITLGQEVGLSPCHLQRRFRAVYAITPHRLQQEKRLELGRQLLAQGESVGMVCYRCGFSSPSSFGKLFKRRFGIAPSQAPGTSPSG